MFELVRNHPSLAEYSGYETLIADGDRLYIQANRYLKEGDLMQARRLFKVLLDFPDLKEEVKGVLDVIE